MGEEGFEPSQACAHSALNATCLPIPSLAPIYSKKPCKKFKDMLI